MGSSRTARDALYRILRQQRPAVVVAIDHAGKATNIALRDGKGRWDGVVDAAFAMLEHLDRLEMRNEKGEVWRTWSPPEQPEDEPEREREATAPSIREDESMRFAFRISEHVQRACDQAVERHLQATSTIMDSLIQVVRIQNERLIQQEKATSSVLKALHDATVARAEAQVAVLSAANGGQPESTADKLMTQLLLGAFAPEEPAAEGEAAAAADATPKQPH